ncbi:hypothetical protein [Paenibacillus sophorae]|nr:hypothetical protein [Paenibacillus sophorae]
MTSPNTAFTLRADALGLQKKFQIADRQPYEPKSDDPAAALP